MDSINRNQPEENLDNLSGQEAIDKIRELVEKSSTCFFCTSKSEGKSNAGRPMSVQKVDEEGILWFLSAKDSYKNQQLLNDPHVQLYFQGSAHSDFLEIHGIATVSDDRAKIEELWEPILKTWFTEGKEDPRISVIRVEPVEGYYWDTKHGNFVAGIKMMIGAALGQTLDDSIEGKLRL